MRFMMLLPAPADVLEQIGNKPDPVVVTAMRKYNDEMRRAGVLLLAEGLHPTSMGARMKVIAGKKIVTDGPFAEAKEVIAGFWLIQAKTKEEAIEWAQRCPLPEQGLLELRQVFENCDFPVDLQEQHAGA
jgi:hypothetical protein